jgi:hypothetical protein
VGQCHQPIWRHPRVQSLGTELAPWSDLAGMAWTRVLLYLGQTSSLSSRQAILGRLKQARQCGDNGPSKHGDYISGCQPCELRKSITSTRRRIPSPRWTTILKISTNTRPGAENNPWNFAGGVENGSASTDLSASSSCVFRQNVLSKTFQGDRPYISSKLRVCVPRLFLSAYSLKLLLLPGQCAQRVSTKTCSSFLHMRRPSRTAHNNSQSPPQQR